MKLFEYAEHLGRWRVLVNSHDIAPAAVKEKHIGDGAVTWKKIGNDVQKIIASIEKGGVALSSEFGDSELIGITQKKLTTEHAERLDAESDLKSQIDEQGNNLQNEHAERIEAESNLQQQIDELKESEAVVGITVNPTLIEVGQTTTLSFNATSDKTVTKIEVFAAGELIMSGENTKTLTGVIGNPFISGTPGEFEVVAEFSYNNNHKSDSAIVTSVLPIYYGSGEGYAAANTKASLRTSPAGIYQVNVPVADKYVYFVIPDGMTIHGAKMGGFDFPLEAPEPITRGGKPYKGYRSCNTYNVGTLIIEIL